MTPVILMLTPVMPSPTGGGSPMRAAAILECLARIGRVVVVHLECWGGTPEVADRSWCRERASAIAVVQTRRLADMVSIAADALAAAGMGDRVDAMYVFRQIVAPSGLACRERFAPRVSVLDLDDDEVQLDRFLASLRRERGDAEGAAALAAGMERRQAKRAILLERFDRVFLSNPADVTSLQRAHPSVQIGFLPNVVARARAASHVAIDPYRMLFLGTLAYLPNEDGVAWFIREVLPLVRASQAGMRLRVAGVGQPQSLMPMLSHDGVDFAGEVPEVAPEYAAAGMLVVPLRAGSGTRIKILESFRHGTAVVSTTVGAAGLDVADGEQLLIADSPEAIAQCCLRLARDAALRQSLAARAAEWVERHHSLDVMHGIIETALRPIGAAPE